MALVALDRNSVVTRDGTVTEEATYRVGDHYVLEGSNIVVDLRRVRLYMLDECKVTRLGAWRLVSDTNSVIGVPIRIDEAKTEFDPEVTVNGTRTQFSIPDWGAGAPPDLTYSRIHRYVVSSPAVNQTRD